MKITIDIIIGFVRCVVAEFDQAILLKSIHASKLRKE